MLTAMGDVMRECYKRRWITTRDGNVSLRRSLDGVISDKMYISPTAVRKNKIEPEHIITVSIGGEVVSTVGKKVSVEFDMHWNLLFDATTTRAVLHVHPTHVIAAMRAGWDLQELANQFPELKRYTRVGESIGFYPVGSVELAEQTNLAMRGGDEDSPIRFDIVGQDRHGVCAVARTPWDAFEHVERLDHICEIILKSGVKPNVKKTSTLTGIPNCS